LTVSLVAVAFVQFRAEGQRLNLKRSGLTAIRQMAPRVKNVGNARFDASGK